MELHHPADDAAAGLRWRRASPGPTPPRPRRPDRAGARSVEGAAPRDARALVAVRSHGDISDSLPRPDLVSALTAAGPVTTLTPAQRALDLQMNASWRCVRLSFELGEQRAAMHGDEALAERFRQGRKRVLPHGIGFISLVGRDEYTSSSTALGVLDGEQAALFRTLPGGAELLRDVRGVHDRYGTAFHITAAAPTAGPESPLVAKAVAEAAAATREFVAAVVGTVRRADPRTRALADRLLAPVAHYGRTPAVPAAPSAGAANTDKTPPVTP